MTLGGPACVWLTTGASRGFGSELTKQGLEEGDAVVTTAPDPEMVLPRVRGADGRVGP